MAKKKSRKQSRKEEEQKSTKSRGRRKKQEEEELEEEEWDEDGSMQQGLLVIILFALAAISFLSFINAAGDFGTWVDTLLGWLFGWGRYATPVIFAVLGYVFLHPEEYEIRILNYIGLALFVLSGLALLHLFVPVEGIFEASRAGRGGGFFGITFAFPLIRFTGLWVTIVVLIGLFIASWLIMFNTSLLALFSRLAVVSTIAGVLAKPFLWIKGRLHARMNGYRIDGDDDSEETEYYEDETDQEYEDDEEVEHNFETKEVPEEGVEAEDAPSAEEVSDDAEQMELIPQKPRRKRAKRIDLPMNLLIKRDDKPTSGDIETNKETIRSTLENFGIEVEMGEVSVGPMVTQYTLKPSQGVKLTQITTLHNDIALALAAHPIRIEAPIPGKPLVGVEVPNKAAAVVTLSELITARKFKQEKTDLTLGLGKDVSGKPFYSGLETMPHVLIAGATGAGKSVCVNGMIVSLLYRHSPDTLKFIMVDPKRVELSVYNDIPHLLTPVITDVDKTINALKWAVAEMERRYELLSRQGKRNIKTYNEAVEKDLQLPYIVFIIDELADLMSVAAQSVEAAIVRLAQMARAVGIHLVLATQRPSVNVITGLIKANMPARIAFSVASLVDSRTILDFAGAEKLLGKGDMLYLDAKLSKPKRLQGAFVDDKEVENIVEYLRQKGEADYESDVTEPPSSPVNIPGMSSSGQGEDSDELLPQAREEILAAGKASASMLQRRLRVGYARAARILDILEEEGFIGPAEGSKPREVLATEEDIAGTEMAQADDEELINKHEQGDRRVDDEFYEDETEDNDEDGEAEVGKEDDDQESVDADSDEVSDDYEDEDGEEFDDDEEDDDDDTRV